MILEQAESRRTKIAFSYLGGKYYHLNWLLPKLECVEAFSFVDLFAGSFAVALNIRPHRIMTVNDINSDVVNFFKILRDNPEELVNSLHLTPYSREEYKNAKHNASDNQIEKARKFYIRVLQSKYSLGAQSHTKGWATTTKDSRAHLSEYINKWINKIDGLRDLVQTLKFLQIENRDFRNVIKNYQGPRTLIYADPPYVHASRKGSKDYAFEMSDQDHIDLSECLKAAEGYKAISGYDGQLMRELYHDWFVCKAPESSRNMSRSNRQEYLWTNYDPNNINKLTLF